MLKQIIDIAVFGSSDINLLGHPNVLIRRSYLMTSKVNASHENSPWFGFSYEAWEMKTHPERFLEYSDEDYLDNSR